MTQSTSKARSISLTIVLVVLIGGGALLWASQAFSDKPATAEEPLPRAPVKWMAARQFFLEEWTEIVGTTLPLPGQAARLTARIEGQIVSVLDGANG